MLKVYLAGDGQLYERLAAESAAPWSALCGTVAPELDGASYVIHAADLFTPENVTPWLQRCQSAGAQFLSVILDGNEVAIGPSVLPNVPGCPVCLMMRRHAVHPQKRMRALGRQAAEWARENGKEHGGLTTFAIQLVVERIRHEVEIGERGANNTLHRGLWILALDTLMASGHRFQPVPQCPVCGSLPADSRDLVEAPIQPRIKADRFSFRTPEGSFSRELLQETLVDTRTGLIANLFPVYARDILAVSGADLPLATEDQRETGIGRTFSFPDGEFTAMLEALERYGGMQPMAKRTVVNGSYRELADHAINPCDYVLHSPEQYELPNFPFVPYHPDLKLDWVWGYSFRRQEPVLVPEPMAYYRLKDLRGGREANTLNVFAYEISNGCALGGCLEEAVLHGLFEAAERDGFLMTWYNQLPVPEIDLHSFQHAEMEFLLDRLDALGFDVHAFNTTFDFGIPAIWVIAVNRTTVGLKTMSAAGAHLDPLKAALGGLVEVAVGISDFARIYPKEREACLPMIENPLLVQNMHDHAMLYALPETFDRFAFLLRSESPVLTAQEAFPAWYGQGPSMDLTEDLLGCVRKVLAAGCDVVVVEQTPPEQRQFGLRTVKVLVTGALAMTFAHMFRRVEGAARLQTVPIQFGYRAVGSEARINPHPHPFP